MTRCGASQSSAWRRLRVLPALAPRFTPAHPTDLQVRARYLADDWADVVKWGGKLKEGLVTRNDLKKAGCKVPAARRRSGASSRA